MRAVNLLPREEVAAGSSLRAPLVAGGAGAMLAAAVTTAFALVSSTKLHERRADLAELRIELAATPRPAPAPAWQARVEELQAKRSSALADALTHRLGWDRIVGELAAVLPQGVWLTHVDGRSPDAVVGANGEGLSIEGTTTSEADVASLLARLAVVPDFTTVELQSSARSADPASSGDIQFRILVGLRAPEATS